MSVGNFQKQTIQHLFFNSNPNSQKVINKFLHLKKWLKEETRAVPFNTNKKTRYLDNLIELTHNRFADVEIMNGTLTPRFLDLYSNEYRDALVNQKALKLEQAFTYIFCNKIHTSITSGKTPVPPHVRIFELEHQWNGTTSIDMSIKEMNYNVAS